MKTLFALLGMLLLSMPLRAAPDLAPQLSALLREEGLDGAVWTTLAAEGAAGVSDARSGAPMRVDQRVHVGSVAKTVLATGILRLVSERRLSLDTRVSSLLPGLEFVNPWEASDPLLVRHLLDHSAGLDDARFWQVFSMERRPDMPLADAFPRGAGLLRVRHRPGSRFSYSNMGYTLLGMIVETVTGQRYERYLDAALLRPLGMHDSSFAFVSQEHDARLAMGHFEDSVGQAAQPVALRPAAQFITTTADMGRFARFLMSDGSLGGKPFIAPALLRRMGEPAGTDAARAGLRAGYGLGLRAEDHHGVLAKCHGGSTVGFRAKLCLFPATRQAFFMAVNTDSETADYRRIDALLVRTLGLGGEAPAPGLTGSVDVRPWEGFYIPSPSRFESMRFLDTVFNFMRVSARGPLLRLQPFQSPAQELSHVSDGLFRAPGKLLPSHALLTSREGARVITTGTQSYEKVSLMWLAYGWCGVAAGLLGLAAIMALGLGRIARRRMAARDPLLPPFAGALALLLPLPFFYRQSLLQLGDLTLASGLLAVVTAMLPLAMLLGLWRVWRSASGRHAESLAMLAVLHLSLVLAAWDLLPLRLWS
ncbi:serine hydrolase domain-containing protein [Massilia sp. DD77]|uniref:serine hydrolase domain-containing protein n=1 Tax=Massilia sp. DD77 TaxID=3109349 RepID=UPI002FFD9E92